MRRRQTAKRHQHGDLVRRDPDRVLAEFTDQVEGRIADDGGDRRNRRALQEVADGEGDEPQRLAIEAVDDVGADSGVAGGRGGLEDSAPAGRRIEDQRARRSKPILFEQPDRTPFRFDVMVARSAIPDMSQFRLHARGVGHARTTRERLREGTIAAATPSGDKTTRPPTPSSVSTATEVLAARTRTLAPGQR